MDKKFSKSTLCVQGGWQPKKGEPRVLPIYQSTTFKYDTSEQMARLFDLEDTGYFYTRLQNPTNDAVAAKIAALKVVWAPRLLHRDRLLISMPFSISVRQVTILYARLPSTAVLSTSSESR